MAQGTPKLAIITTHPVQYYAPIFQLLTQRKKIEIKVFYTWGENAIAKHDPGFGRQVEWDIPLLDGYNYDWVKNTSKKPGSDHFNGIINPDLIDKLKSWQPNAILVFGWAYHSHLQVMRQFKNKLPVYFRGDSTLLDEQGGLKSLLKTILLTWVYRHVDHAFYVGTNNKVYFKKYGLKDDRISFTPHAVDNERFGIERTEEVVKLRERLGIASNATLVLFAGKLEEKKSPLLLLQVFLSLNRPDAHLLFAGNGDMEAELKQEANSSENVHFIDFQNQSFMPVVYQACDLFCLPSKGPGESWGLAVNEAMACKKAVLVSDKCGCAVDLVKTENGLVFKAEDFSELQSALATLLSRTSESADYGIRSQEIIVDWTFAHVAAAIETKTNKTAAK